MSERAYEGWVIRHHFLGGNLFGGEDEEGIDREGSVRRYAELCREALVENYPGADIQVTYDSPNVQGSGGRTEVVPTGEGFEVFQQAEAEKDGLDAILSRVFEDGNWYVERRYGLQEFAAAVGMDPRRLSVERGRGKLPAPEFELACGPVWTHEQVEAFRRSSARKADERQTGLRPTDSAYDRDFGQATTSLIDALREASHEVETPVTGAAIVNGIEIPSDQWDAVAVVYSQDGDLEATMDHIRETFGPKE